MSTDSSSSTTDTTASTTEVTSRGHKRHHKHGKRVHETKSNCREFPYYFITEHLPGLDVKFHKIEADESQADKAEAMKVLRAYAGHAPTDSGSKFKLWRISPRTDTATCVGKLDGGEPGRKFTDYYISEDGDPDEQYWPDGDDEHVISKAAAAEQLKKLKRARPNRNHELWERTRRHVPESEL